eukprot:3228394-Rhodomonas_salina.2
MPQSKRHPLARCCNAAVATLLGDVTRTGRSPNSLERNPLVRRRRRRVLGPGARGLQQRLEQRLAVVSGSRRFFFRVLKALEPRVGSRVLQGGWRC